MELSHEAGAELEAFSVGVPEQSAGHAPAARPPIRVLPPAAVALIAAGEIIERPASVVKELVENALDAGATRVRVDVQGGGLRLIRVGDDGVGIPSYELLLACRRHATSKLTGPNLSEISTLGFRGEALPSIAAVAELSIVSAVDESGVGQRLTLLEGRVVVDEPAPRPRGTTVSVRHLFQNIPARLAVASRPQTEVVQIGHSVRRLALAAPQVRIELFVEGRPALRTTGSGDLQTTLTEVYGPSLTASLLPLGPAKAGGGTLRGVVGGPELTRPGRGQVHLVINGRWVQPRALLAQIESAYRPVLPRGRHPVLALRIDVAPDVVDLNIHPSKLEVRLLAEREIGAAAGELIRGVLAQQPLPLRGGPTTGLAALPVTPPRLGETRAAWNDDGPILSPGLPPLRLVGQVQDRLLLLEGPQGLYMVDQHRAHERILYEHLAATSAAARAEPEVLPEPLLLELTPAQATRFGRRLEELAELGFQWEEFGGRSFLLRAAPSMPGVLERGSDSPLAGLGDTHELGTTVLDLADEEAGDGEIWRERLLVRLACRTAVRRGRALDRPSMRALVEGLGQTGAPAVCPHGSPLLMHVSGDLLERQFGWR